MQNAMLHNIQTHPTIQKRKTPNSECMIYVHSEIFLDVYFFFFPFYFYIMQSWRKSFVLYFNLTNRNERRKKKYEKNRRQSSWHTFFVFRQLKLKQACCDRFLETSLYQHLIVTLDQLWQHHTLIESTFKSIWSAICVDVIDLNASCLFWPDVLQVSMSKLTCREMYSPFTSLIVCQSIELSKPACDDFVSNEIALP